jgi:lipopolysaccharide/colanic/teichoic acid biosynthesis glycosyltransferase
MLYFVRKFLRSVVPDPADAGLRTAISDVICRDRYQISVGIVLSICIPMIVRNMFSEINILDKTQYDTAIGTAIAIIFGYISFKKIHIFPGITSGGYIATSLTLCFGMVSVIFLLARLEYTTIQLFFGYIVSIVYFIFVNIYFVNRRKMVLGIIPSSSAMILPKIDRVVWYHISTHVELVPSLNGVVVDLHATHSDEWSGRIATFALEGVPVYHFKDVIENLLGQVEIEKLSENTLGALNPNDLYLNVKAFIERIGAFLAIIVLVPVFVFIALAIRIDSPGPVLFKQTRMGFRKRVFTVYKFRTMIHEKTGQRDQRVGAITRENDSRITKVGRYLRKYRLDELPQLFNIVRGEMSLVGPRPEVLALSEWYEKEIPFYHYRHIIKPGITGWAQVNQGHVAEVSEVRRKLNLDFYYVKNFSFWLDIYIILKTLRVMLRGHGAK